MSNAAQVSYYPWWEHDDTGDQARSASLALSDLHRIELLEAHRRTMDRAFVRWYGDTRYNGFSTTGPCYPSPDDYDECSSNENVIREIVTTLHNKFAKNKPQPTAITTGGTYKDQEEAEARELWVRGAFQQDKIYEKLAQAQFNSMMFCDGFVGVRDDYEIGRPVGYQFPPYELHLDPPEGTDGTPQTVYRVGSIHKDVLAAKHPEFRDQIRNATLFFEELWNVRQWNSDTRQINFYETWHLPSKPGADDGRHLIGIQTATLVNEPWPFDYFPFVKVPWNPRPFGYFSAGLIEDLLGPQRQMNRVRNAIDEHLRLLSSSFWYVARGSNVVKSALSNLIGRVVEGIAGQPPQLMTPEPVSNNLLQHQETLRNQAFAQARLSQLSAQGVKPAGLNSGKALRVYADQEEQGFTNAYIAKETAVCELATLYTKRAQAMLESDRDASLTVRLSKDSQLRDIEWKDTDLDSFRFEVLPASSLSTTLAGRLEDIEDLEAMGLIHDEDEKRQLLQFPDLEASNSLALAPRRLILKTLQTRILQNGEGVMPEPYWPLALCAQLGLQVLCQAQLKKYPQDRVQLLQNWNNECVARMQALQPPPAAPANSAGMASGAPIAGGPIPAPPVPEGPIPGALQDAAE